MTLTHINSEFNRLQIYARNKDIFRAKIRAKNIFNLCDELLDFRVNDRIIMAYYLDARNSILEWEEELTYTGREGFAYYTRININIFKIQSYINIVKTVIS